ncbi:MAG: glucosidase, partial [Verrucomicrobiota bacterium]
VALWNRKDPFLKERLFGLTGPQGNHGEDVKELYYYLDDTPTSSYLKALYKYPHARFPYEDLIATNAQRSKTDPEYELLDTGIFQENQYWDVLFEGTKASPNDLLLRVSVTNHGSETVTLDLLPHLWFRNTWSWSTPPGPDLDRLRPSIKRLDSGAWQTHHPTLPNFRCSFRQSPREHLFTENETNTELLFNVPNAQPYVKDAFHRYLIDGDRTATHPDHQGSKAAALHSLTLGPDETSRIDLRLASEEELPPDHDPFADFDALWSTRTSEAEEYYRAVQPAHLTTEERGIHRQASAGLFFTKQFYHYSVKEWLAGDPAQPKPPTTRSRNEEWTHLYNRSILSMPDKWEYPWFAAWDTAFHTIPFISLDPEFAKDQLVLFLREWYMHPNGQIPAYEWNFSDVNPPVHAWAVWRVYQVTKARGQRDRCFLGSCFHKLLLNFTWWVNRKDPEGKNVFAGGFLGLDNIGAFDRSRPLPDGTELVQADGTAWMAFYCGTMLRIALELASEDPAYEGVASKFLEHFVSIADAANQMGLWHEEDGFYYDLLRVNGEEHHMAIRSLVGLLPLCSVVLLDRDVVARLPHFQRRMEWFVQHHHLFDQDHSPLIKGDSHLLLSMVSRSRLERVLARLFDPEKFLSPYGIRSLSKQHETHPFRIELEGTCHEVRYTPAESDNYLFGGNSNWRGPVWFPINFLLIESLHHYHHYFGSDFTVELPTGSENRVPLNEAAADLSHRLTALFRKEGNAPPPHHRDHAAVYQQSGFRDLLLFYEYFHPETGRGVGASHQTGWTALVSALLEGLENPYS